MKNINGKKAVSSTLFGVVAAILIITTVAGFGLYATSTKTLTMTNTQTATIVSTEMMSQSTMTNTQTTTAVSTEMMSNTFAFNAKSGAMISNAYMIIGPINMHQYAVAIHAEGLEPNGDYIVEAALSAGSMQTVPISSQSMSMNTTSASEFQANANGTGSYWIEINTNPLTTLENVQLYFLPAMSMQNATLVATATLAMM